MHVSFPDRSAQNNPMTVPYRVTYTLTMLHTAYYPPPEIWGLHTSTSPCSTVSSSGPRIPREDGARVGPCRYSSSCVVRLVGRSGNYELSGTHSAVVAAIKHSAVGHATKRAAATTITSDRLKWPVS